MNKLILLSFLGALVIASNAKAEVIYTSKKPSKITASAAIKAARNGVIYKCSPSYLGPNGNPVKVKGSDNIFTTDKVEHDDAALDSIIDGKVAFKCQAQTWSPERRKLVNQ